MNQLHVASLAGPVIGSGLQLLDVTLGNVAQASRGQETHARAEMLRWGLWHTPFINLWYARGVIDRAVMHDIQELLSPGYLRRMRERAERDWGQDFWWRPGEELPDRMPDIEGMLKGLK